MKTTLTTADLDQLTFAAGLLRAIPGASQALLNIRDRQRELTDEPDAKDPDAKEPSPMAEGAVAGVLPQAFRFTRRSTGGSVTADFHRISGVAGWRISADSNSRHSGGWYSEAEVRELLASGAWKYDEAVPPLKSMPSRYESPTDIVDPMRRMEEKVRRVEASDLYTEAKALARAKAVAADKEVRRGC